MNTEQKGIGYGLAAYVLWGVIPLYWKLLPNVPSLDILCYRIIWSFVLMTIYFLVSKKKVQFVEECRQLKKEPRKIVAVICSAIFITINWFTFIYMVGQGKVTEASLGYYMNPLVNVLLAMLILKEPLSRSGKLACMFALIGVLALTWQTGTLPVPSLIMAFSFSTYGILKKGVVLSSTTGLALETMIICPFALGYLLLGSSNGFMNYNLSTNLLLIAAGLVTAIPLLLFAEAAKRISYIVLGFIQYINPTMMLLLAVFIFHEPYTKEQFIAFGFIWTGIAIFTYGNLHSWFTSKRRS